MTGHSYRITSSYAHYELVIKLFLYLDLTKLQLLKLKSEMFLNKLYFESLRDDNSSPACPKVTLPSIIV